MLAHCPTAGKDTVKSLLKYFKRVGIKKGEVLWKQGGRADRLLCLVRGQLVSYLEEEVRIQTVDVSSFDVFWLRFVFAFKNNPFL